ncbi:uncharacterized protein OGAPODRAFT_13744 [Ogataea polymorpha]|uniref:uncharacterized protein n=1 Tax=Ogataea polymorpha TaxID=460523 RepID=UPI0007F35869|nr:uncharacterized protein OGAPODRAFT_13744 [Ogataea polymorpha]OBA14922.1 hypothetical protein OGAPODRAFT_13744 [Ogataea polymorpha]
MAIGQLPKKPKLFTGTLLSFDSHMNLVLADAEEFRLTKRSKKQLREQKAVDADESGISEEKRLLGLVILRGETVVSIVVEAGPNLASTKPALRLNKGKGSVKPLKTLDGVKTVRPAGVTKPRSLKRK